MLISGALSTMTPPVLTNRRVQLKIVIFSHFKPAPVSLQKLHLIMNMYQNTKSCQAAQTPLGLFQMLKRIQIIRQAMLLMTSAELMVPVNGEQLEIQQS